MTPEQISRNFVCDPAILNDAKVAISGLDSYPAFANTIKSLPLASLTFVESQRALLSTLDEARIDHGLYRNRQLGTVTACGGAYTPSHNSLHINTGFKNDVGVRFERHQSRQRLIWDTNLVQFTVPFEHVDTVLMIHELSHMIDFQRVRKDSQLGSFVQEAAWSAYGARRYVSRYAGVNPEEWFAETMSAYVVHPDILKDFDPLAFSAMKATLEL